MVEIADIKDRESLQAWLEETGQPREACIALVHRAAMRVMPLAADHFEVTEEYYAIPVLRALLVSGVASGAPLPLLTKAGDVHLLETAARAAGSADALASYAYVDGATAYAARAAAGASRAIIVATDPFYGAGAADYAATAPFSVHGAAWEAVRSDCQNLEDGNRLIGAPLWKSEPEPKTALLKRVRNILRAQPIRAAMPTRVARNWSKARVSMQHAGMDFWVDWYERALTGEPQLWPLLVEIALQDEPFWQGSADEVMERINKINGRFEAEEEADGHETLLIENAKTNSPNAERVFLNDQGQFDTAPETDLDADFIALALERALNAVDDIRLLSVASSNAYVGLGDIVDLVAKELARSSQRPQLIYEALMQAVNNIDGRMKHQELPKNDEAIERFRNQLSNSAIDILLHDGKVSAVVEKRAAFRANSLTREERQHIEALTALLIKECATQLAEEMLADGTATSRQEAEKEALKIAAYRYGSRVVRMWSLDRQRMNDVANAASVGGLLATIASWFL